MIVNGYALERISDGSEIQWWADLPQRIEVETDHFVVMGNLEAGWQNGTYRLVAKARELPDPPTVRRSIEKSTIIERLTDAQLDAAISLMTTRQKERWRMPGHPAVYVDDPEVLGLLQAVGADPNVVLAQ